MHCSQRIETSPPRFENDQHGALEIGFLLRGIFHNSMSILHESFLDLTERIICCDVLFPFLLAEVFGTDFVPPVLH